MSLYPLFEWLVLGGIAAYSAATLLKRFAPKQAGALGERYRRFLGSRVANWLVPPPDSCDDGCSACGKCDPAQVQAKSTPDIKVIAIHRPPRP